MKIILVLAALLVGWCTFSYLRNSVIPRRRIRKMPLARGAKFRRVGDMPGTFGWPGYVIEFDTQADRTAFAGSGHHEALLQEVQRMHGEEVINGRRFDPRRAVEFACRQADGAGG